MNRTTDQRLKKTLISVICAIVSLVIVIFFASYAISNQIYQSQLDKNAQIIGLIQEEYHLDENEIIEILTNNTDEYKDEGYQILEKYGYDYVQNSKISGYESLFQLLSGVFTGIILLFSCIIFLIVYIYLKRTDQSILNISEYINRLLNKDYALDIIDNDEGSLSSLKNDIYKVTVVMKEQNELLKHEKMVLANNLADISHQLKTPLTSMLLMSELLENDELSQKERKKFLDIIQSQLHRIEWLVSSLLKMAKLDAKTIVFKHETIYSDDLIFKAIEPIQMLIKEKNQKFILKGDNPQVSLDINWTVEAFVNIIKNCSEHTPENGQLLVEVFDTTMYTEFKISDNGVGIEASEIPFIFDRFYRASKSKSDSVGIGLAMSYSIITSQNGTIRVKSKINKGTSFSIRFYKK